MPLITTKGNASRSVRDAEAAGSNPVASTEWLGTPESLILKGTEKV